MASIASEGGDGKGRAAAPAATDAPQGDEPLYHVENHALLVVGVMMASTIQVLDTTIANVALPHMQSSLGATVDMITWVLTSYIIASAVAMPITGWLADRVGARRLFIGSVAGFIVASMLCGMAQNLTEMVIFRAMQGVAGAFIAPLGQSFLLDCTRPSRHAKVMAIWGGGIMIGPIVGPIIGGWLTENWDWRWVFYVNVPVGIVTLALLIAQLPHREVVRRKFDLFGFALLAIGLSAFQLLLDRGSHVDWYDSLEVWIYTLIAASALWMAVVHLATAKMPLFDPHIFKDRNFIIALFVMTVMVAGMFAPIALLPPMLQHLFGYSVIETGLVLTPRGVGVLISMQLSGFLVRAGLDSRFFISCGFALMAFSMWQMSHWSLGVDQMHVITSGFIQGLGMGLIFIPLNISAFATLPPRFRTDASSLLNLVRSLGSSIGISVVTVVFARNVQIIHSDLGAHVTGGNGLLDVSTIDRYQALGETALALADAEVNRQAMMLAYVDDFYMMMWVSIAAIPLGLLMRKNQGGPPAR